MVLDWDPGFFTRWVPKLTITICNKITVKGLTWYRQSLLFSSPLKRTKSGCARRVLTSWTLGKDSSSHLMYHDLSDLKSLIRIQTISKECTLSDRQEREGFFKIFSFSCVPSGFLKWHKMYKKKINKAVTKGQQTGICHRVLSEETKRKMEPRKRSSCSILCLLMSTLRIPDNFKS